MKFPCFRASSSNSNENNTDSLRSVDSAADDYSKNKGRFKLDSEIVVGDKQSNCNNNTGRFQNFKSMDVKDAEIVAGDKTIYGDKNCNNQTTSNENRRVSSILKKNSH